MTWTRIYAGLTIAAVLVAGAVRAHGAEVAADPYQTPVHLDQDPTNINYMNAEDLFGGKDIPKISHATQHYAQDYRTPDACVSTWDRLLAREVTSKPIQTSFVVIMEKARRAGLKLSETQLKKTIATFLENQGQIQNQRYVSVIDYTMRSNEKRLFVIDLQTGDVNGYLTAAGSGSDRKGNGYATRFSNTSNSRESSLGCFIAAGEYNGKHGRRSLRLHGFSSTNDNACKREVVMHPANYVGGVPGRSYGCPALRPRDVPEVFKKVGGGGLICSYTDGTNIADSSAVRQVAGRGRSRARR